MALLSDNWGIIGHTRQIDALNRAMESGRLAHAYIFSGPRHVGKTAVLEQVLTRLLSTPIHLQDGPVTTLVSYICLPEDKKEIPAELVRKLLSFLRLSTFGHPWKIAVIDDAEHLNPEGAHALLKTLEEPTPQTIIFLLVQDASLLLPTIRSRAATLRFSSVPAAELREHAKGLGLGAGEADELALISLGLPGLFFHYLRNQADFATMKEAQAEFLEMLGQPLWKKLSASAELAKKPLGTLFAGWQLLLRDALLIKHNLPEHASNRGMIDGIRELANTLSSSRILEASRMMAEASSPQRQNANAHLFIDNVILSL